jgi:hypothetical protein
MAVEAAEWDADERDRESYHQEPLKLQAADKYDARV